MTDFRNSNGLMSGKIPAGTGCHFFKRCGIKDENCPSDEKPKKVDFSCGLSRMASMVKNNEAST